MVSPAQEFSEMIEDASIGTRGSGDAWSIHTGSMPDKPDEIIASFDTGSFEPPDPKWSRDFPTVQVLVRGAPEDFPNSRAKADAIKNALLGLTARTVGSNLYVGIYMLTDIIGLGRDESDRPRFSLNFRTVREQPASGNRE